MNWFKMCKAMAVEKETAKDVIRRMKNYHEIHIGQLTHIMASAGEVVKHQAGTPQELAICQHIAKLDMELKDIYKMIKQLAPEDVVTRDPFDLGLAKPLNQRDYEQRYDRWEKEQKDNKPSAVPRRRYWDAKRKV